MVLAVIVASVVSLELELAVFLAVVVIQDTQVKMAPLVPVDILVIPAIQAILDTVE